jgi:hypothetical protein
MSRSGSPASCGSGKGAGGGGAEVTEVTEVTVDSSAGSILRPGGSSGAPQAARSHAAQAYMTNGCAISRMRRMRRVHRVHEVSASTKRSPTATKIEIADQTKKREETGTIAPLIPVAYLDERRTSERRKQDSRVEKDHLESSSSSRTEDKARNALTVVNMPTT